MQNKIRCVVTIDGVEHDVTSDLKNWDDISTRFKRENYSGVVRTFAGKFEFKRAARALFNSELRRKFLKSAPSFAWYERNEGWRWDRLFQCVLDISSYEDDGAIVSMNSIDSSLASLIKAKKGTQYEYVVDLMKEETPLNYDGLLMKNSVSWLVIGEPVDGGSKVTVSSKRGYLIPLGYVSVDVGTNKNIDFRDQEHKPSLGTTRDDGFLIAKEACSIALQVKFSFKSTYYVNGTPAPISVALALNGGAGSDRIWNSKGEETINVDTTFNLALSKGNYLSFRIDGNLDPLDRELFYTAFFSNVDIKCEWMEKRGEDILLDVIDPASLLNRLLKSMNGGSDGITGEILTDNEGLISDTHLLAAESVRGIAGAKLYTSFTKFCSWMSAEFGFVYQIDGDKVKFLHRDSLYSRSIVKELGSNTNEFSSSIDPSLIYSRVRVGYTKQEYDSVNGRDEFRFTTEYASENTLTDNKIELISPYRADAYGIEFLAHTRGKDTTDSNSDNDLFFVGARLNEQNKRYELIRDVPISGVVSIDTMFNSMYSPRQMLLANLSFIGISIDKLEYASSDGNSDVVIDGVSEKDDVVIERKDALFLPIVVQVNTSNQELPTDLNGLITIEHEGEVYRGYVMDIERYHGKIKSNSYKIMLLDIIEEG